MKPKFRRDGDLLISAVFFDIVKSKRVKKPSIEPPYLIPSKNFFEILSLTIINPPQNYYHITYFSELKAPLQFPEGVLKF